jgi:hypothetical protein
MGSVVGYDICTSTSRYGVSSVLAAFYTRHTQQRTEGRPSVTCSPERTNPAGCQEGGESPACHLHC